MKTKFLVLLFSTLMIGLSALAQTAPGAGGESYSSIVLNWEAMFLRGAPISSVLTATFTFCILLFVASSVRKLDDIHKEIKRANEKSGG